MAPPTEALLGDGVTVPLAPLADKICRHYEEEFPDEQGRYGDAWRAWCVHDNQHLLYWGAESVPGHVDMHHEVGWLANVLDARGFPLLRLARNLDIGAEVVLANVAGDPGRQLASALADAAEFVRLRLRGGDASEA